MMKKTLRSVNSFFRYTVSFLTIFTSCTIIFTNLTWAAAVAEPGPKIPTTVGPTDSAAKANLSDASFVEQAAANLLQDAALSKLALQKSKNEKLKKFAQKVADESPAILQKLKQVAAAHQLNVPSQLNDAQRQTVNQVQQLNDKNFDSAYIDVMKKSQDIVVGLFDNAAGQTTLSDDIRSFVAQQLPKLAENQTMAHALTQTSAPATDLSKP